MQPEMIEYRIEQKFHGHWFRLDTSTDWHRLRAELNALREQYPDREYQLIRIEIKQEVIG